MHFVSVACIHYKQEGLSPYLALEGRLKVEQGQMKDEQQLENHNVSEVSHCQSLCHIHLCGRIV